MVLKPASDVALNGVGTVRIRSKVLGGVLISADGTNDATVRLTAGGDVVFYLVTKTPAFICAPILLKSETLNISCTGTGASCFIYEWES